MLQEQLTPLTRICGAAGLADAGIMLEDVLSGDSNGEQSTSILVQAIRPGQCCLLIHF